MAVARRSAGTFFRHPEWVGWAGMLLALLGLFLRLGSAGDATMFRWISSDTLWIVDVFVDVFHDHYSLSGWRFSIAPFWFPDVAITGIFWGLTRNPILATLLAGFIQVMLIVACFHLIASTIGLQRLFLCDTLLLACGTGLALYLSEQPNISYPNLQLLFLPEGHVGNMLLVLFGWGMALRMIRAKRCGSRPGLWLKVVYAAVCLLAGMSNLFFFAHMLVPLTVALAASLLLDLISFGRCGLPVVMGWLAAAAGAILNRLLFHTADVSVQSSIGLDPMLTAWGVFRRGFSSKFLAGDPLHLAAVIWAAVCIGYVAWFLRSRALIRTPSMTESHLLRAIYFTMALIASVSSVAVIVLGGTAGLVVAKDYPWSMHYLHETFFVPIFGLAMCSAWVFDRLLNDLGTRVLAWTLATCIFCVAAAQVITTPWPKTPIYAYRPPLVRFIDRMAPEKHLHYGYAGYWQARLITLLSRSGVRAYALDGGMNPLIWANNVQWYSQSLENRSKPPGFDFVVLDDPLWKLSREEAVRVFGEPVFETKVEGARILIYSSRE